MTVAFNQIELKNKSGSRKNNYLVVDTLPTKFRSYKDKKINVRDLNLEESLNLSRFVGDNPTPNYAQLINIYDDVIKGEFTSVGDLEVIDFIVLSTISSIFSMDKFQWNSRLNCSNTIKDEEGQLARCSGVIAEPITLDDMIFDTDNILDKFPISITIGDTQVDMTPITLNKMVEREKYIEDHPNLDEVSTKILGYACSVGNMNIQEAIEVLKTANRKEIEDFIEIEKEFIVKIKPILKECPVCNHKNKLIVNFNKLRGYP